MRLLSTDNLLVAALDLHTVVLACLDKLFKEVKALPRVHRVTTGKEIGRGIFCFGPSVQTKVAFLDDDDN